MAKTLKKILKDNPSIDYLKNKGEKTFARLHKVMAVDDANGNDDAIFKGRSVSPRKNHGASVESSPKDSYGEETVNEAGFRMRASASENPTAKGKDQQDYQEREFNYKGKNTKAGINWALKKIQKEFPNHRRHSVEIAEGADIISAKGSANAKKVGKGPTAKVVTGGGQQPGKTDKYVKEEIIVEGSEPGTKEWLKAKSNGPKWKYHDARGVEHTGYMEKYIDRGGTDHTAYMRHHETGELSLVSGSRLKNMKRTNEDNVNEVLATLGTGPYYKKKDVTPKKNPRGPAQAFKLSNVKRDKNGFSGTFTGMPSDNKFLKRWGVKESTDLTEQEYYKLSIPLLIRLMEYAREDAKTDMDLHNVAERIVEFGEKDLCMDDYKKLVKETVEHLHEANVSRRHFRDVANTVRAIENPEERQKFADHHAAIFARQNPRFDHARFHAAAGTQYNKTGVRKEETNIDEGVLKTLKKVVKGAKKAVKKAVKFEVDNWKRTDG